ncbi:MAG TPA: hypothetical protein VM692_12640 [Gammaproteobacteria bacterium]|nr:hypothetical protein [Gammaproteobacteria bacterium]
MTAHRGRWVLCAVISLALAACNREPSSDTPLDSAEPEAAQLGLVLSAEDREKLGVELDEVASATFQPTIDGPAYVVDAQAVVGAMAELGKAEADARTSQAALKRTRDLFNNDTAVSAEALEAAERAAATDDAQLRIARARATLAFGATAPWLDANRRDPLLAALSGGSMLLISASFPSGLGDVRPDAITLRRVGNTGAPSWTATEIWAGPSDANVPGPTLLALLDPPADLSYGERLRASAPIGATLSGVTVPVSAVVLAGGEAWCYVESADEELVRRRVDLGRPVDFGYFHDQGFASAERIVTAGAGLLLARELGGGAEED